jgi:hypothetical protein
VIAARTITSTQIAQKLEISEQQWLEIEILDTLLKPFKVITTLLCGEKHSPTSMVGPLLKIILGNYLKLQDCDDQSITHFEQLFLILKNVINLSEI